jgi:hypothetical protein
MQRNQPSKLWASAVRDSFTTAQAACQSPNAKSAMKKSQVHVLKGQAASAHRL